MARFLDRDHPMFRRTWVRWVTVLVPLLMALLELWFGSPGWSVLFGAASAYAAWELLLRR